MLCTPNLARALALVVTVGAAALSGACSDDGDDDAGPRADAAPDGTIDGKAGGCAFPAAGADGKATVTPGQPSTLDERQADAMNTLDHERHAAIAPGGVGAVRRSSCGDWGLLLRQRDGNDVALAYVDLVAGGAAEPVEPAAHPTWPDAGLFFDDACTALVIRGRSGEGYAEYVRAGDGSWDKTVVLADLASVLGGEPSSLQHLTATVGGDGKLYVFARAQVDGGDVLLRGSRAAQAGASWSFTDLPWPAASDLQALRVDSAGATHALYRNSEFPCDPCNVDFYYATLAVGGTSWSEEVVQAGQWGAPDDAFVERGALVLDSADRPYVAAHFIRRVVTGSYKSAELRLYGKVGGDWCGETIVDQSDGFAGGDGTGYTGADPQLRVDDADRLHLLFRDQAVWHDSNGQNEMRGQLRYAIRSGTTWSVHTLLEQQGQLESANPLMGLDAPVLAIAPDGQQLLAGGVAISWQTDSIYNTSAVPATYEALALLAAVELP